jgi:hypothetical protein
VPPAQGFQGVADFHVNLGLLFVEGTYAAHSRLSTRSAHRWLAATACFTVRSGSSSRAT